MPTNFSKVHLLLYADHVDQDYIVQTLQLHKAVKRWALCLHDLDGDMKPHFHVLMDFGRSYDANRIPGWFAKHPGIAESKLLEPVKSWPAMVQYLIHKNDPAKYQYPVTSIVSSYDISEDMAGSGLPSWFGQFEQKDYFSHLRWIEGNVSNVFTATKYYRVVKERYDLYLRSQGGSERDMKVVFIEGPARIGKSTFARWFAKSRNLSYFQSSSGADPMDGYSGQEVLILDDLRDSIFSLTDLLKLLDNHGSSLVRSRYYNKAFVGKYVLITSVQPLDKWYKGPESKVGDEPLSQLYGRISIYVRLGPGYAIQYDKVNKDTGFPVETLLTEEVPFDVKWYILADDKPEDKTISETAEAMRNMVNFNKTTS